MLPSFAGMVLLVLHTAQSRENTKAPRKLDQIIAAPGDDVQISCSLSAGFPWWAVVWYKEQPGRGLRRIYVSHTSWEREGKYSGRMRNLTISNAKRNNSGVYYCASSLSWNVRFLGGARVIITDAPGPSHSTLAPFASEGTQPHHSVPVLRLTLDADPTWDNFSWEVSEESSRDRRGVGAIDEDGVFSIWHFEMVPGTEWTGEVYSGAVRPTDKGNCFYSLYFGIPSIIILLVPALILLFRKHRAREHSEEAENQIPEREIPGTNYAEVRYKNRNVLCVD